MKKILIAFSAIVIIAANFAFAENHGKQEMKKMKLELTKEQRELMAAAHEKMAVCLRSEKAIKDCRDELRKTHMENMGKDRQKEEGTHAKGHEEEAKK